MRTQNQLELNGVANILLPVMVLALLANMSMSFGSKNPQASRKAPPKDEPKGKATSLDETFPPEKIAMIKKKAIRRYRQNQDKQWDNWFKSMAR